jgi:hypothetical protein
VVRVNDEITVDLMTSVCGVTFAEAKEVFILRAAGGVEITLGLRPKAVQYCASSTNCQ